MRVAFACVSLLALTVGTGQAQAQVTPEVAFNAAITSDYVFRGFSQTDTSPAVQGGIDLTAGAFYVGAWASQVDFGDDTDAELDIYGGVAVSSGGFDFNVGVIAYHYVGAPNGADYDNVEFKAAVSRGFGPLTAGAAIYYSPDFFGADEQASYVEGNLGYALRDNINLTGAYGKQYLDVGDDYSTWNAGVKFGVTEKISLDLRYWGTDVDGDLSDDRLVATLGVGF
ncbi:MULTISPECIES: TorF family putative porin [unclassified Brevundimonas]|uniref:TorF family putative porin n=1 Tax=unclassified Brevundimonas TaxID=2622653 RepID=UPI0025C28D10|nr:MULTISPECIES: TorF family putative porin [unclassified Brevundimonas]